MLDKEGVSWDQLKKSMWLRPIGMNKVKVVESFGSRKVNQREFAKGIFGQIETAFQIPTTRMSKPLDLKLTKLFKLIAH